jgi:hypothetical protein
MLVANELGYNPYGTMYNIIRMGDAKKANEEPVLRTIAYRNKEGLAVIKYELAKMMDEVTTFNENEARVVYRNPTRDCHWDCNFYSVCLGLNDSGEAESVLRGFSKRPDKITEGVSDDGI